MYYFVYFKEKFLKLPIPKEWSWEEIQFFITGKENGKKDFNPKPWLSVAEEDSTLPASAAPSESVAIDTELPISEVPKASAKESAISALPKEVSSKLTFCKKHPKYTGMRKCKGMVKCSDCIALYNAVKASGIKESRK